MNGNRDAGHHLLQEPQAGRDSAIRQLSAKLNTVGSPARRDFGIREGLNAKLQCRLQGTGGGYRCSRRVGEHAISTYRSIVNCAAVQSTPTVAPCDTLAFALRE